MKHLYIIKQFPLLKLRNDDIIGPKWTDLQLFWGWWKWPRSLECSGYKDPVAWL